MAASRSGLQVGKIRILAIARMLPLRVPVLLAGAVDALFRWPSEALKRAIGVPPDAIPLRLYGPS